MYVLVLLMNIRTNQVNVIIETNTFFCLFLSIFCIEARSIEFIGASNTVVMNENKESINMTILFTIRFDNIVIDKNSPENVITKQPSAVWL